MFVALTGSTLVPILHYYNSTAIRYALYGTGVTMASLMTMVYNSPDTEFFNYGGVASVLFGVLITSSIF